ncbi:MAG: methyltransferase domain-containing protein [Alphaproteobacteria bacterium]|nr:methyltransferase domain-containing protein [Alphaproteobacteria bacterium]
MTARSPRDWNPEAYARDAAYVPVLGHDVLRLVAPRAGEHILDLGCGDGALTAELVAAGAKVTGVDASPAQVAAARARGLDAREMAGDTLTFTGEFDAVFSNAALHWMRRPDAVVSRVFRALRPGGRFVAEFGGAGNIARLLKGILAALAARGIDGAPLVPWFFPTPEDYFARLTTVGFEVHSMEHFPRPTDIGGDIEDWLNVFGAAFDSALPESEIPAFHADVARRVRGDLFDAARGTWWVDHVRLRFHAVRP